MRLSFILVVSLSLLVSRNMAGNTEYTAATLGYIASTVDNIRNGEYIKKGETLETIMKDLPPTLAERLKKAFPEQNTTQNRSKHDIGYSAIVGHADVPRSAYDFVVDLTRPADIYEKLQSYHVSFPQGKENYDSKVRKTERQPRRFMVNVVGRYNVGKTYVLRLLANIDLGHSFIERTNGISVSLPTPKSIDDPNIALIDTAGTRTPVDYSRPSFQMRSYERQISDAFIQEIALNSSEIFLLVINQLTLDDQLYLKALYKRLEEKNNDTKTIKQRLLIVHNYFNLRTEKEVEETAEYELGKLFGASKQHEGYWLSDDFKHFILANSESEAGVAYNNHTVNQLLNMIKGSHAAQVNNVLEHIMYEIQLLLHKFLEGNSTSDNDSEKDNDGTQVAATLSTAADQQKKLHVSRKGQLKVELEIQQLPVEEMSPESLWFICPKAPLSSDVFLSKNLKFNQDGSVYIDFSSQFIPDVHIAQSHESGDIKILIECPSCSNSSIKVLVSGTTLKVQGEKFNEKMNKDYLNTRRIGKFELEVPLSRLDDSKTFDFRRIEHAFKHGIIIITVPVVRDLNVPRTGAGLSASTMSILIIISSIASIIQQFFPI